MASSLVVEIRKKFGITAKLKEGHNGIYEVTINGYIFYTNQSACGQLPTNEDILQEIRKYRDPLLGENKMENMNDEICGAVRENYGKVAVSGSAGCGCGCNATQPEVPSDETRETPTTRKVLNVDLLVINLDTCKRCVPTGDQLKTAVQLLKPVAEALGIELRHHEIVVQTPAEAEVNALLSSPTIRLNGRDIAQDIRESVCESCGDITTNNTSIDCREWHYRGKVFSYAPLPLLTEAIMGAMLNIDEMPLVVPAPLEKLPENLQRYFDNKKESKGGSSCCG